MQRMTVVKTKMVVLVPFQGCPYTRYDRLICGTFCKEAECEVKEAVERIIEDGVNGNGKK